MLRRSCSRFPSLSTSYFLSIAVFVLVACGGTPDPATAIVIRVESNLSIPDELDEIVVRITVNSSAQKSYTLGPGGTATLPIEVAAEPNGSLESDVDIDVEGLAQGEARILRSVYTTFVARTTKLVRIRLERECLDQPTCTQENETCIGGRCRSGEIAPHLLPTYEPRGLDGGMDARAPLEGGADVRRVDGGTDGLVRDAPPPSCATSCDDGNFCNGAELCVEGRCVPGTAPTCMDTNPCTRDSCTAGGCTYVPDNSLCMAGGQCTEAGCRYAMCDATNCPASDPATCTTGRCEDNVCRRSTRCMAGQACCAGECVRAGCNDDNSCTTDSCGGTGCVNTPATGSCTDGNACTQNDVCVGGACMPGAPRTCMDTDGNPCTGVRCNTMTGNCENVPNDSATCADALACNGAETCSGGVCMPGTTRNCNDNIPCTTDTMMEASGACTCVNTPNNGLCTMEAGGTCVAGTGCRYPNCTVANCDNTAAPCERKTCVSDMCVRTPLCTGSQTCCGSACVPAGCTDSNPCTRDACSAATSLCTHTPDTALACSGTDPCKVYSCGADGTCFASDRNCEDGNVCTVNFCRAGIGCDFHYASNDCNDSNPCTIMDRCNTGVCSGTFDPPGACNFGNPVSQCQTLTCNPTAPTPCLWGRRDGQPCEDGNPCTQGDACEFNPEDGIICRPGPVCPTFPQRCCPSGLCCGTGLSFNCQCAE